MPSSLLKETQAISEIADLLYSFFKKPAIIQLLQATLDYQRDQFCNLIVEIVRMGITYRSNKREPVTRDEIVQLNQLIKKVNFKIPELWDPAFLDSLPSVSRTEKEEQKVTNTEVIENLKSDLIRLTSLKPQDRGFAFEKFLKEVFAAYNLDPRGSFRIVGEQIDGSFQIGTDVYPLEAKWHDRQIGQGELLIFHGKVEGKSSWSRGLFVSYSGFTSDGLTAYSRGRSTNIIGMDSQDLFHILNGEMTLVEAINKKARRAAETGEFFVSVYTLSKGG